MPRHGRRAPGTMFLAMCLMSCMPQDPGEAGGAAQQSAAVLPALSGAAVEEARRFVQPSNDLRVDALLRALEQRGLAYRVQEFAGGGWEDDPRPRGRNVVVTLGSGTPEIIVGAHIDAYRLPGGALSDAMVDNGAAAVVLLHVADALRDATLRRRVRMVFFDMEETGLVGSRAFVQSLDPTAVAAMINADVVANGETLVYGPQATSAAGAPALHVQRACARRAMSCVGMPGMPPGDDVSFMRAGIPTVSLAVLPREDAHRLWLSLHGDIPRDLRTALAPEILRVIHTERDTAALLTPVAMTRLFHVITDVLLDMAGRPA